MKKYLCEMEEDILREKELREMDSEELLQMYGKYKLFQGDESNGASPVAWDIDFECKLIFSILLERLKNGGRK